MLPGRVECYVYHPAGNQTVIEQVEDDPNTRAPAYRPRRPAECRTVWQKSTDSHSRSACRRKPNTSPASVGNVTLSTAVSMPKRCVSGAVSKVAVGLPRYCESVSRPGMKMGRRACIARSGTLRSDAERAAKCRDRSAWVASRADCHVVCPSGVNLKVTRRQWLGEISRLTSWEAAPLSLTGRGARGEGS